MALIALRNPPLSKRLGLLAHRRAHPGSLGTQGLRGVPGSDREAWKQYDTVELIRTVQERLPLLVDQGLGDEFLESQLQPDLLRKACDETGTRSR